MFFIFTKIKLKRMGVFPMKKLLTFALSMIGAIIFFASVASAHVTVNPRKLRKENMKCLQLEFRLKVEAPLQK